MILLACQPVGIEIWLLKKCNTKLINYECAIIASATALYVFAMAWVCVCTWLIACKTDASVTFHTHV